MAAAGSGWKPVFEYPRTKCGGMVGGRVVAGSHYLEKAYKVLPSRQTNPGTMGKRTGAFVEDLFFKLSVVMIAA